jgi:hypothetical protein
MFLQVTVAPGVFSMERTIAFPLQDGMICEALVDASVLVGPRQDHLPVKVVMKHNSPPGREDTALLQLPCDTFTYGSRVVVRMSGLFSTPDGDDHGR